MPGPWRGWSKGISCKSQKDEKVHSPVPSKSLMMVPSSSSSPAFPSPLPTSKPSGCSRSIANLKGVIHGNTRVVHKSASCSPQVELSSKFVSLDSTSSARPSLDVDQQQQQHQHHNRSKMASYEVDQQRKLAKNRPSLGFDYQHQPSKHRLSQRPALDVDQRQMKNKMTKFGGCHGCNVAEGAFIFPNPRDGQRPATCQACGASFVRYEALESHHALRHAVTELGRGDSSRNVVEIIFKTSWITQEPPVKIDRILKVNNSARTIARFEEYRDMVKSKASNGGSLSRSNSRHARCIADGNELLRFYATSVSCELGARGSPSTCSSSACGTCRVVRCGFSTKGGGRGIHTAASSGRAHEVREDEDFDFIDYMDQLKSSANSNNNHDNNSRNRVRAMLVCRVIAGRMVQRGDVEAFNGLFDSVATEDDLYVFNSRAVLPCFVVMYRT